MLILQRRWEEKEGDLALEGNEKKIITNSSIFDCYCEDCELYWTFSDEKANACLMM